MIRELYHYDGVSLDQLAADYSCARKTIQQIVEGDTYRDEPGPRGTRQAVRDHTYERPQVDHAAMRQVRSRTHKGVQPGDDLAPPSDRVVANVNLFDTW